MAATGLTTNYGYATYNPDDVTSWLTDFNGNWEKADAQFKAIEDEIAAGGAGVEIVQNTGSSTTAVMSQNAVTGQLNTINSSIQAINTMIGNVENALATINTGAGV